MQTAIEAQTEQSLTMFCMISCGRRGSDASDAAGMTSVGRFQMEEGETEPR
jgi:hypothetical protein